MVFSLFGFVFAGLLLSVLFCFVLYNILLLLLLVAAAAVGVGCCCCC